jgi:hypothetical protein
MYTEVSKNYMTQQVFNLKETGVALEESANKTYTLKGERTMPGFKAAKEKLMLLLGAKAEGNCKLKLFLVYYSENPYAFKGLSKATLPADFCSSPKARMTTALPEVCFMNCFIPKVEKFCRRNDVPFGILFITDSAPGYPTYIHTNVKVDVSSTNMTSILQLTDEDMIMNFKAYFL